jgi:hypothetical protein
VGIRNHGRFAGSVAGVAHLPDNAGADAASASMDLHDARPYALGQKTQLA